MALLLLATPASVAYDWRNVVIEGGGFVTGIITHPRAKDVVYARTDIGGAYRWDARARRWAPVMDWITRPDWNLYGVESVALDPTDPKRVYIAAGTYDNEWGGNGAILRSADGGRTWQRTDLPTKMGGNMPGRSIGERLAVDPTDPRKVVFGSRNSGLLRSVDHGATWSRVESFPAVVPAYDALVTGAGWDRLPPDGHGVGWVTFHGRDIYAGIVRPENGLVRSPDGGTTWEALPDQPKGMLPHQAKFDAAGRMVVVYSDAPGPNGVGNGAVWRFEPKRGTWTDITPEKPGPGNTFGYGGVAVDPKNPDVVMVSTLCRWSRGDTVFRTVDGGKTWRSLKETARRDPSRAPYLKWGREDVEFGHWIGDVEIDPHNPDQAWYVTGATIWATVNLQNADRGLPTDWLPRAQGLEETAVLELVSPPKGAHVVSALGDIAGFAHVDLTKSPAGGKWTNADLVTTNELDYAGLRPEIWIRLGRTHGNDAKHNAGLSTDGGNTWRPLATDVPGRKGSGSAAISADGATIVWAPEGGKPHVSDDGGKSWHPATGLPPVGRVVSDKVHPRRFYFLSGGTLYRSQEKGSEFQAGATGLPEDTGRLVAEYGREGVLWLPAKGQGLHLSKNGGLTFRKVPSVQVAEQVGVGAPAPGRTVPTVYLNGTVGGVIGVFRSTDEGATWVRINDAQTGFGTMNVITGDPKRFGRVYLGTNGRGVLVGDPRPIRPRG